LRQDIESRTGNAINFNQYREQYRRERDQQEKIKAA